MTLAFKFNIGDLTVGRKGRKVQDRANMRPKAKKQSKAKAKNELESDHWR